MTGDKNSSKSRVNDAKRLKVSLDFRQYVLGSTYTQVMSYVGFVYVTCKIIHNAFYTTEIIQTNFVIMGFLMFVHVKNDKFNYSILKNIQFIRT